MDPLVTAAGAIRTRRHRNEDLARSEREFETLPWWGLMGRFVLSREIESLRYQVEVLDDDIDDEKVRRLAEIFAEELWKEVALSVVPEKNPFGPAAQGQFRQILAQALKELPDLAIDISTRPFHLIDLPEVDALVTDSFIESNTLRNMAERQAVAASTDYIHEYARDYEGRPKLTVQHRASGLRARFTVTGRGMGEVYSKPYDIESIDPEWSDEEQEDWKTYAGLGIGAGIYAEAHRLEPGFRWSAGLLSPYAVPLRRRLHVADPYIWAGPCDWCDVNLPAQGIHHWMNAVPSSFAGHP